MSAGDLRPAGRRPGAARRRPIYTDHFLDTQPIDGPIGYKLEAPPLHPLIFASTVTGFGREAAAPFARLSAQPHALLALLRDGFHAAVARRPRQAARRRLAGARLPADRLRDGRRAPRAAVDGRDPVRRRRARGAAGARAGARPTRSWARGQARDRGAADEAAADASRQRACDGRLRPGRRREARRDAPRRPALAAREPVGARRLACSRPASAPIRSCRSTASSTGWPPAWRKQLSGRELRLAA